MQRLAPCLAAVLLFAIAPLHAAPIPKVLKRPKGELNGVWQLTESNSHGKPGSVAGMVPVWEIEGDDFYVGRKTTDGKKNTPSKLTVVDEKNPDIRRFGNYNAAIRLDGDMLCFCYADNLNNTVTECEPSPTVHYYVFKRITDEK